jgi:F0F1-type ATP synthase membrane subunit a
MAARSDFPIESDVAATDPIFLRQQVILLLHLLCLFLFVGINIICIQRHKFHMLSFFIPANTSFGLALLLVPIELISYIFRPFSLGV